MRLERTIVDVDSNRRMKDFLPLIVSQSAPYYSNLVTCSVRKNVHEKERIKRYARLRTSGKTEIHI